MVISTIYVAVVGSPVPSIRHANSVNINAKNSEPPESIPARVASLVYIITQHSSIKLYTINMVGGCNV